MAVLLMTGAPSPCLIFPLFFSPSSPLDPITRPGFDPLMERITTFTYANRSLPRSLDAASGFVSAVNRMMLCSRRHRWLTRSTVSRGNMMDVYRAVSSFSPLSRLFFSFSSLLSTNVKKMKIKGSIVLSAKSANRIIDSILGRWKKIPKFENRV